MAKKIEIETKKALDLLVVQNIEKGENQTNKTILLKKYFCDKLSGANDVRMDGKWKQPESPDVFFRSNDPDDKVAG